MWGKELTSPHLSSSRSVAHKAAPLFLHLSLSLARALASSQDFQPAIVLSFSTVRRQVVLGRPIFLLPIGVQVSAVAQWCTLGILRTCPKNLHLLLFTSILILVHPALSLSSSIDTMEGQNIPRLLLRHWYWKESSFLLSWTSVFHVSLPYNRTGLTKVLRVCP